MRSVLLWAIGIPLPIILHSVAGHRPRLKTFQSSAAMASAAAEIFDVDQHAIALRHHQIALGIAHQVAGAAHGVGRRHRRSAAPRP